MFSQRAVLLPFLFLLFASAALPQPPETRRADYDLLQRWRFRTEPIAVPAGGVRWSVEGATWTFESGRFWLEEPTSAGAVTGLVFEGKGRFQMEVPDASELAQLRRFAKRPDLERIDETFSALLLRSSGDLPIDPATAPPARGFEVNKLARERHLHWLSQRFFDADARVIAALATPGDRYLRADMRTDSLGWLAWEYDSRRMEEIRLESFNTAHPWVEFWLSLDRAAERDDHGRPTSRWHPAIDIQHVDIAADLTKPGHDKDWTAAQFKVGLRFTPQQDGARAVQLYLANDAEVKSVGEGGRSLPFLRDHIGERSSVLEDRLYDSSLVVLLDQPLVRGVERRLDFEYKMDIRNYAPGRDWYPSADNEEVILPDAHTARLELTVREKHEARAVGRLEEGNGEATGRTSTSVWVVDQPVKMLTFSFADHFREERLARPGVPEVICFGSKVQVSRDARFREVAEDVSESLGFYQQLFDAKLPETPIYVTSINGYHGQAFDGFIHLAEQSFDLMGPGLGELFRGHEAAHQFWGVLVGAATYRDAWLSEAFAEYSAMMFVEASMKEDGPKFFQEIMRASQDELLGSIKTGFSKFSRMRVNLLNRAHGERIGPIGHGWRANTGEVPTAYGSQVYAKGAMVLHMLRGMLRDSTGSDQAFIDVLRDFVRTYRGGYASTRDFEAAVARRAPGDWSWFFDEWVRGTAIPTYRWSYELAASPNAEGKYLATLKVRQSDVPEGFKMSVPVAIEFADGRIERRRVMVDEAEETFSLEFPERPRGVTFNPESEVLARVRRE